MERWFIVFLFIYVKSNLLFHKSQARELSNYPECVQENNGSPLTGVKKVDESNSASNCVSYCKETQNIFSGTQNTSCICGNTITIGTNTTATCLTRCPGNTSEICGGINSVSLRRTGYEDRTAADPKPTKPETPSEVNVSPKAGTTTSSIKGSQIIALYIALPVVVIVSGSAVMIVYLILRHKRQMREGNLNRPVSRRSNCEPDSQRNETLELHNYWTVCEEETKQTIPSDDSCYAEFNEYSTTLDSNDTLGDNKTYDMLHAKQTTGTYYHAIYSHLPETNTTDNTYSHIGPASEMCMNKTDNTYNTFRFSQFTENKSASSTGHDRATTRDKKQLNVNSEHAGLNKV